MQTKYNMIKQVLKSRILDGTYVPHQKISSENQLMKEFGVSRHTVRIAIGELVNEGWLYREQGAGTFCADRSSLDNGTIQQPKKNIALVTTYISDYIFPSIIRGAESYLSEQGYQVSLHSTNNDTDNEKRVLESILSQQVAGVIVEPTKSAFTNPNINYYFNLERLSIPYLMINAFYEELEPVCLIMDDERGGFIQTEHLIKQGHKNIVGFFKTDDIQEVKRMKGYIKAHRTYGVPINPNYIISYSSKEKQTKPGQELDKLLSGAANYPTALVCYNDELAIILLDVLRKKRLHVPNDISIIGYDDSFFAEASEVKLTTIKHPKNKMGEDAARMIISMVEKNNTSSKRGENIIYQPELIIRQSTRELKDK